MIYGSVCSGIEAATVAWHPLGWKPAFFSEIEAFPRAVLQHHYPDTPLHGDFTTIEAGQYAAIDLLVGGTPCQDFSIAGLRAGLDGDRGNLSLEFLRLADRLRPRWLVWENVPGVFSANEGRAFGAIVGALGQLGYGWAYRVLDAQYFGVPQRRRRVFLVGCFGNANAAAAVLFERESLSGHPSPRREAGAVASALTANGTGAGDGPDDNAAQANHLIAHSLRADGFDASEDGTGRGTPLVPVMAFCNAAGDTALSADEHTTPPITTRHGDPGMVAYQCHGTNVGPMGTLRKGNGDVQSGVPFTVASHAVRRLTPRECERLQGFPDDYTLVPYRNKPAADGPRYKALGNSMAVPCMAWIGERIVMVEQLIQENESAA